MFKVASWNLNSVRSRLTHVTTWLKAREPDVLLLQELKGTEFPAEAFKSLGYESVAVTQKAYNGVAILSRHPANTQKSTGEFDHWFPHWMRGSDTQENIWFEPHAGTFGSFAKDKVELLLWQKVCVNKTMTLDQAKTVYLKGWTKLLPQH
jgi:hypothetical protein